MIYINGDLLRLIRELEADAKRRMWERYHRNRLQKLTESPKPANVQQYKPQSKTQYNPFMFYDNPETGKWEHMTEEQFKKLQREGREVEFKKPPKRERQQRGRGRGPPPRRPPPKRPPKA